MALVVNDRVKETSTTTGTGTFDLDGAALGFETFVSGIGNANTTYYSIVNENGEFEVGLGTVTDAATDTLSRDTILSSSNSDAAVNFSAGTKDVFCTLPASKAVILDSSGNIVANNGSNLTNLNADNLASGTVPDARFPATLPAANGSALTNLNADNLASGTLPDARFPATLPAISGANLTNLDASDLASGTVPIARIDLNLLTTSTADGDGDFFVVVDSVGAEKKLTKANINISGFNNDSGFIDGSSLNASNLSSGTIPDARFPATLPALNGSALTNLNASNLASGTVPIARIDLNLLTTSTADGDGDFFVVVDSVGAEKKLTKGNINISGFNNNSGFTTNTGTVTSVGVTAGSGLTGGGTVTTSGTLTLNVGAGTGIDVAADAISVDVSDFMTNGVNNRVLTATGTDAMNAEANMTFDGTDLSIPQNIVHLGDTNCYIGFHATDQWRVVTGGTERFEVNDTTVSVSNATLDVNGTFITDKGYIAETTLTDGATISWNMSTQSVAKVTLAGNRTVAAPTNGSSGQFASLLVIQDGTGSRTLTWNAVYEFAADTAPTLSTTGGKADLFVFRYNGTKWLEVGRNLLLTVA